MDKKKCLIIGTCIVSTVALLVVGKAVSKLTDTVSYETQE